ncbi:SRPBCC family protein [Nannocystis bainbridge]|uniref:SRPBCC family protein n=1 Tax=Nannocystis bainbridge TaxID=2995303 RepID=A0ABT5DUJ7_9BACT|nr:SRPBCC family protein [Nannocystis bainbridge]MDC0716803.1 SRPBCC family protein [Nannocystis bainbridge]
MTSPKNVPNRHGSAVVTLPSDTEILITRVFDYPAELIFKACTTPALIKRWWGFETGEWLVCEVDLREGGRWRYVVREQDMEVGFHGEYRQIDRPHRVVSTEVFEGFPDGEALNTMTLEEVDGVTTMRTLVKHSCQEHRDGHINSGMESGMQVSYDRMEAVVAGLREAPAAA